MAVPTPIAGGINPNAFISPLPSLNFLGISNSYQVLPLLSVTILGSIPNSFLIVLGCSEYFLRIV